PPRRGAPARAARGARRRAGPGHQAGAPAGDGLPRGPVTPVADGVVLFDLDGVLADSRAAITGCINAALAASGRPERPPAELYGCIGPPLPLAFGELIGEHPDSEAVVALVVAYRARYATASLTETVVTPGLAAALEPLRRAGPPL